jgi:choline-sulfatase
MRALWPVVQAGLLSGAFEGGLIVGHRHLAGEGPPRGLLEALVEAGGVAGLHLVLWLALGLALLPLTRGPFSLLRGVLTLCALGALAARVLVEQEAGPGAHPLLLVVLLGLWLTPHSWRERLPPLLGRALAGAAVLGVSVYSLWGRAPDFRFDLVTIGWLLLGSAATATVVTVALSRWPRITGAALAALVGTVAVWAWIGPSVPDDRPSVLFVLVDTTRRDHVRPFDDLVETFAIEELAARGILFSDAVTVIPKTSQSVASFLTARYPVRHGLRGLYDTLGRDQPNVARAFQEAGYSTAALVNNPWVSPMHGFGHGFDRYYGTDEIREDFGSALDLVSWGVLYDRLVRQRLEWRPPQTEGFFEARASDLTRAATQVLQVQRHPFFLYVHYFQPHWPYMPPPHVRRRYGAPSPETSVVNNIEESDVGRGAMIFHNPLPEAENEGARRLYRAETDDTMVEVGRLLDALEASPWARNTIVVFTADHGHALGEHAYYFHHGAFLYEPSVRIPLILSWPGRLPEGRVVGHQVRSIDVAPTLLDLAGLEPKASLDGRSLVGYWAGGEEAPRGAFLESDVRMMDANERREVGGVLGKLRAWRDGRYKLILTPTFEGPRFELYDLAEDPAEARDLAGDEDHQEVLRTLKERLEAALPEDERTALGPIERGAEATSDDVGTSVGGEELELLRQLGYVE